MLRFMVKAAFSMLAFAGFLYATFFVPLGQHTLYAHLKRIAGTEEARELGAGVSAVVDAARAEVAGTAGRPVPARPELPDHASHQVPRRPD